VIVRKLLLNRGFLLFAVAYAAAVAWLAATGRPLGDAIGGAVSGAGLVGPDVVVGHEVDRCPMDAGDVPVEDDRAVHLGQLA